jgi:hypothetical protein
MDVMGWSNVAMVRRYAYVTARLGRDIADWLNAFFWMANDTLATNAPVSKSVSKPGQER